MLYEVLNAEGGIRTHEAVAVELKSTPFDRSGTSAMVNKSVYAGGGIRTHEAVAVELKSTPFDRSGTPAIVNKSIYAPWRARTADLRVISTLLYQLS